MYFSVGEAGEFIALVANPGGERSYCDACACILNGTCAVWLPRSGGPLFQTAHGELGSLLLKQTDTRAYLAPERARNGNG